MYKNSLIEQGYPENLLNIIDCEKFYNCPVLDLGDNVGGTCYIDFIKKEDFMNKNSSILRGHDMYNRPFVSFLYKIGNNHKVVTFFRRYSDENNKLWQFGGDLPECMSQSGGLHEDNIMSYNDCHERHKNKIKFLVDMLNNSLVLERDNEEIGEDFVIEIENCQISPSIY
jgi:hypothetical protein